jgi:hypothetical protein
VVKGLEKFREWFRQYTNQYVLIGGTAASLTMEAANLDFRLTKDLDIVLVVEALTPDFAEVFWAFVTAGQYEFCQKSDPDHPTFYRFQKSKDETFPAMLELFSRSPDLDPPATPGILTPIPFDESVSSLSAILLNEEYYGFLLSGRRIVDGLAWIGEDRLIPFKARAWMDLTDRKNGGAHVDSKNIKKHLADVYRLSQLLTETTCIELGSALTADMKRFLALASVDVSIDFASLKLDAKSPEVLLARIATIFGLADA